MPKRQPSEVAVTDDLIPTPITIDNGPRMDNLRYGSGGGERIDYSVDFNRIDETESMNHTLVFRVRKPASSPSLRTPNTPLAKMSMTAPEVEPDTSNIEIAIETNLHTFTRDDRFQRFILDIQKDGKAGGMNGGEMITIMKDVLGCEIKPTTDIDTLIEKLENTYQQQSTVITRTPKPKWDERDETGLYKMCVTPARLLVLETGALSKFATFKVFEKGQWQACNAFRPDYNGWWDGTQNFFDIIADGYAFQGKTFATIMDPASPIQSPMFPAIHFDMNKEWFRVVYGIPDTSPVRIQLTQDIPTQDELNEARRQLEPTSTQTVPDGASRVTYSVTASSGVGAGVNALVYSSIPNICQVNWKETSRQELGKLSEFLQGNAENGKLYKNYLNYLSQKDKNKDKEKNKLKVLQCMIGKENGDCCQVYALISNVIVMAAHMASAPGSTKTASEYFKDIMKNTNMVTCDRVVYLQCMALNVPCTYHGAGNGEVKVFNPYNATPLSDAEKLAQLKNKVIMTADDTIRNIERYRQSLAKALASGLSVLRYRYPDTTVKQFPRNCFDKLKKKIDEKIEELYTTIDNVIKLKETVSVEQAIDKSIASIESRLSDISRQIDGIHSNPSYKCVETTTEYSKYAGANNRIFVLNESVVGKVEFDGWVSAAPTERTSTRGSGAGQGGRGKKRISTNQAGGVPPLSGDPSLNPDAFEDELHNNPQTIMEYYHYISNNIIQSHKDNLQRRLKDIDDKLDEIRKPTGQSLSPARVPTPRQTTKEGSETESETESESESESELTFQRDNLLKELNRVDRLVEVIQEIDKEKVMYWENRNKMIRDISKNEVLAYENIILDSTDIETLATVYECCLMSSTDTSDIILSNLMNDFITPNKGEPLSFHSKYAPIIHQNFNDIKGRPTNPEYVKLLLYGETTDPTDPMGIDDISRVSLLCLLYLILNEVILDMVPLQVFMTSDDEIKQKYMSVYNSQSPSPHRGDNDDRSEAGSGVLSQSFYSQSQSQELPETQESSQPRTPSPPSQIKQYTNDSQFSVYLSKDDDDIRHGNVSPKNLLVDMDESQNPLSPQTLNTRTDDDEMDAGAGGSARKSLTRRRHRNRRKTEENTRKKKRYSTSSTNAKKSNKKRISYRKHRNTIKKRRKNRRDFQ